MGFRARFSIVSRVEVRNLVSVENYHRAIVADASVVQLIKIVSAYSPRGLFRGEFFSQEF